MVFILDSVDATQVALLLIKPSTGPSQPLGGGTGQLNILPRHLSDQLVMAATSSMLCATHFYTIFQAEGVHCNLNMVRCQLLDDRPGARNTA
jgi:hypothetical protein